MSNVSDSLKETEKVIEGVIDLLADSQKGFAHLGESLKDDQLKRYFLAESLKRASFRGELESELHRDGVKDVKDEGTVTGTIHRFWGDLKAKIGVSDHELLATAEQGEDQAKKIYADALSQELPAPVRELLSTQQKHIISSHDYVRDHRDAVAAK